MSKSISEITVNTIAGQTKSLSDYTGNVVLIVNVASSCGYTSQYRGLETLSQKYYEQGLRVLGFPCNDFGAQEPGSNEEIQQFCDRNYGISFELFDKIHAKGAQQHPLYAQLTSAAEPAGDVSWNFEKFLIGKQGQVVARFRSGVTPDAPELVQAIEQELAK
jgi:glutathione peroxidase